MGGAEFDWPGATGDFLDTDFLAVLTGVAVTDFTPEQDRVQRYGDFSYWP
ncbi:hypothetical protein [uncultured Thioclava sp.]|nr:hypothetical protein [uncultured Thioclava sp.]